MRTKFNLIILIILLFPFAAHAQDDCTFDFSKVIPMLQAATTLDEVVAARVQIQLQEAECTDFRQGHGGDTRTNPVPFGEVQDAKADHFEAVFHVTDFNADADAAVAALDQRNDPPLSGQHYVLVGFNFACNHFPQDSCEYHDFDFSLVGDKGVSYRGDDANVRGVTGKQELFGGAAIPVTIAFLVDDDDAHFVLFTEYGKPRTYFATE